MKKILIALYLLLAISFGAQVGINTVNPHASAGLDIHANNKGVSFPAIFLQNYTDLSTISAPKESLLIYNTNNSLVGKKGYYFWNGVKWDYFFSDLNQINLMNQTKFYSATSTTSYIFSRAAGQFYGYSAHLLGESLSTSGQWTELSDLTKTVTIDRATNDVLMNVNGMFQANNGSSNTTSGIRTSIGFFVDDKLVDVKPLFLDFNSQCSFRQYMVYGNIKNLPLGNHTVKFAIRNIESPSISGLSVTYGAPNSSCSPAQLSNFETRISATIYINQPYVF